MIGDALKTALRWWLHVLTMELCHEHPWSCPDSEVLRLFVDAAGNPARCWRQCVLSRPFLCLLRLAYRCAAVLFVDGVWLYTDGKPSKAIVEQLTKRKDSQIMALESIAIALGLCTFAPELHKRKVVVYSDNTAAEAAAKKGSARSWDHAQIVHQVWKVAAANQCAVWIERVESKKNLADLPSRCSYELMERLGAKWRAPVISENFI